MPTLLSCQSGAEAPAQNEWNGPIRWLAPGIGLSQEDFEAAAKRLQKRPPVFIRHICPAAHLPLGKDAGENETALSAALAALGRVGAAYSVQCRFLKNAADLPRDIAQRLAEALGGDVNVKTPEKIYSVLVTPDSAYIGLSDAKKNLSPWTGGQHRFAREEGQLSRAEFKLLEALDVFDLELSGGHALDLGAAPGGWTRVLRRKGFEVVAVDPALLHEDLMQDAGVEHVQKLAHEYFPDAPLFDLIVNDMRMDAPLTARMMLEALHCLPAGGRAIVTLKLPENAMQKTTNTALAMLREGYDITHARQLFHNRSEVTVALLKK